FIVEPVEVAEPVEATVDLSADSPVEELVVGTIDESAESPSAGISHIDGAMTERCKSNEDFSKKNLRIQVSAKHLTLASPIFKNILTGGWKESVTLLQQGSMELTTSGWDLEALLLLLKIIHCQHDHIPRKLSLEMLAKIAVIADYYDCKKILRFFLDVWIGNLAEVPEIYCRDLVLWLWVSWVFKLPRQFERASSISISQSKYRIRGLALPIPNHVLDAMNSRREHSIEDLVHLLHTQHATFLNDTNGCSFECRSIMYGALTKQMQSNELLSPMPVTPFTGLSYQGLAQKVRSFKSPQWRSSSPGYPSYGPHSCFHSTFEPLFGHLHDRIGGLALDDDNLDVQA
ncbi:uncharacterized protein N7458_000950, partial [Penicillium daleae]